jgi:hypothetical protein
MKVSLLKILRRPERKESGGKLNFKTITFVICLILSAGLWTVNTLSKKYTDSLTFTINYEHLKGKDLVPSSDTIRLKLTSSGFRLMAYKFGINHSSVMIDANQYRRRENTYYYVLTNKTHLDKIEEQFGDEVKLVDIYPDTLYLKPQQARNSAP